MERNYLLLTPGPLSTSDTVRQAMMQDWCTWDKDYNEGIVTPLRRDLLEIAGLDEAKYTTVLLQGSGTYCVEATIGATVRPADRLLILANGTYGQRMARIADYYGINYSLVSLPETELVTGEVARRALEQYPDVTHLAMVHSETTTGLLNRIEEVADVIRGRGLTFIVDAMSSFAGVPIDIDALGIDFTLDRVLTSAYRRPGLRFHHRPPRQAHADQGMRPFALPRHLRPVGNDGARPRQVALHVAHARGARLLSGHAGTQGRGRHRRASPPLRGEPPRAGRGNAEPGLPDAARRRGTGLHYHLVPLS